MGRGRDGSREAGAEGVFLKNAGGKLTSAALAGVLGLMLAAKAPAQETFTPPELTGPVVDQANVIDGRSERAIESGLRALRAQGGSQINILTVPTLGGLTIEQASIRVVDQWRLGGQKADDGALIFLAIEERKLRIEVGQGLEGKLTDADSKRIIDQSMVPLLRAGDISGAMLVGVYQVVRKTDPGFDISPYLESQAAQDGHSPAPGFGAEGGRLNIGVILFFLFILFLFGRGGRRRRRGGALPFLVGWGMGQSWGGGGGRGGGFGGGWGGGGGGFSGGGASGDW